MKNMIIFLIFYLLILYKIYINIKIKNPYKMATGENIIVRQLMKGVKPTESEIRKIETKYTNEDLKDLAIGILKQDKNIIEESISNYNQYQEKSRQLDDALISTGNAINIIAKSVKQVEALPLNIGVENKLNEFSRTTNQNEERIKKINEGIPEIQRKKKENDDFFKKFVGEKKVWLDRLIEDEIREQAYSEGFKYLYEAKTIKLLIEGILLEKVQDKIEKVLSEKGEMFGWKKMDIEKLAEERKNKEFELNSELLNLSSKEANELEKEKREEWEKEDRKNQEERENIMKEWKKLWAEIWIPGTPLSDDQESIKKRKLMEKVTMEVTFEFFKHICFDIWKFKNMVNSSEEYVVMDKIRRYFPDRESNGRSKDENILDTLMSIIDGIKQEEEIIYCDTNPAKDKVVEYFKNTSKNSEAIKRLTQIIDKIDTIQDRLEEDSTILIRPEVEEIRKLIKAIPDDKERKLFQDNLYDDSRLYNGYLPLTNVLMVVLFLSIGKKRDKNYQDKIDSANQEIAQLKGINKEINGKWQLLKDMKEKLSDIEQKEIINGAQKQMDDVYAQNYQAIIDARDSLNKIIEIKNKLEKSKFEYYKNIRDSIIKPKDI